MRGRQPDQLWRSFEYEDLYLHEYAQVSGLGISSEHHIKFYNYERSCQSLSYQVAAKVHLGGFDSLLLNNKVSSILAGLWS